jgi:phosphate transport system substrate-binding protein
MRYTNHVLVGLALAGAVACGGCGPSSNGDSPPGAKRLKGGGSTFIGPLFDERWIADYGKKGVEIDYVGKGSGPGITAMINDEADFGCTDAIMSDDEIKKAGGADAVLHIPLVMGAVVPIYNLDGVDDLQFDAEALSGIFRGQITFWDDDKIKGINKDKVANLHHDKINVVTRAEGSGTSFILTSYLTAADKDWKDKGPGKTKLLKVEGGQSVPGGSGPMAEAVKSTKGAIGYVELLYALKNPGLKMGRVKSHDGDYLPATLEGVTAAAEHALPNFTKEEKDSLCFAIVDAPGKDAYAISGTTWAVVKVKQPADKGKALKAFLKWALHEGQDSAKELHYAPLPKPLVELAEKKLELINDK